MARYTEKDAAKDTNSSVKEVKEAWHEAREKAAQSGELWERGVQKLAKELGISTKDINKK
jgi:hypothetical protein